MRQVSNRETSNTARQFYFNSKVPDLLSVLEHMAALGYGQFRTEWNKLQGNGKLNLQGMRRMGLGIRKWKSTSQNTSAIPQSHVGSRGGQAMNTRRHPSLLCHPE